jgi:septal ring factor EnvC (AmiA/AmiB activator)
MVDADSVLQGMQERDKWRRRTELLERSLGEVRDRRRRIEVRLKKLERDLSHLKMLGDSIAEIAQLPSSIQVRNAPRGPIL